MRLLGTFALATLPVLLSCGGGGGGSAPAPAGVAAPTNLRTIPGPDRDHFTLRWDAPAGTVNGLNLEARVGTGTWGKLNSSLLPPDLSGVEISFPSQAPEDVDYEFRVNSEWGSTPSAYSNTVLVHRGLRAPGQATGAYDWNRGGVALIWLRNSTLSTGTQVERRPVDAVGNPTGGWVVLPAPEPGATAYLDTGTAPGVYYAYRVTNTRDTLTSAPGPTSTPLFTGLPAPSSPTVSYDFNALGIALSWNRNTAFADGTRIERQVVNNNPNPLGDWTELTTADPAATTYFDATAAPNAWYVYRITNLRGGVPGLVGPNSPTIYAGLPPAPSVGAYWYSSGEGSHLTWYKSGGDSFEAFRVDRVPCDPSGQLTDSWTSVATIPATGSTYSFEYNDTPPSELAYYRYRIAGIRGNLAQEGPASNIVATGLFAPTGLTATATPGGISLTWQNQSHAATQVEINRGGSGSRASVAVLSAGTTSYLDPNPPLGYYSYSVTARAGDVSSTCPAVSIATPNPPGALDLASSQLNSPAASDAGLGPSGTWAFLSGQPFGVISNNDPWLPYFPNLSSGGASYGQIQVDQQGWPHTLYLVPDPQVSGAWLLKHDWAETGAWKTETIASTNLRFTSASQAFVFRLDHAGSPHVLIDSSADFNPYGGSTNTLRYVHKANGQWVSESLSGLSPSVSNIGTFHLDLDGSDAPHILLGDWSRLLEYTPSGIGGWTSTILPAGAVQAGWYEFLDGRWNDADNGCVFYERNANGGNSLMALQKVGGAWQAPVPLATRQWDGASTTARVAVAKDGTRPVILYSTTIGLKAYHLFAGTWIETLVAPPISAYGWMRIGVDGAQKLHILLPTTGGFTEFRER